MCVCAAHTCTARVRAISLEAALLHRHSSTSVSACVSWWLRAKYGTDSGAQMSRLPGISTMRWAAPPRDGSGTTAMLIRPPPRPRRTRRHMPRRDQRLVQRRVVLGTLDALPTLGYQHQRIVASQTHANCVVDVHDGHTVVQYNGAAVDLAACNRQAVVRFSKHRLSPVVPADVLGYESQRKNMSAAPPQGAKRPQPDCGFLTLCCQASLRGLRRRHRHPHWLGQLGLVFGKRRRGLGHVVLAIDHSEPVGSVNQLAA